MVEKEDHEQTLFVLLDELGRSLARQERLFEEIEGRHVWMRDSWVRGGAEDPLGDPSGQELAGELQRELDRRRDQELELHEILDVLKHRRDLQDRLLGELEPHLVPEHRDELFDDLQDLIRRRDETLDGMELRTFEEKRAGISTVIDLLPELEGRLFGLVERHLVRRHQSEG